MQQGNASHNQQGNASLRTAILTLWLAPTYYAAVEQRAALPEMRRCRWIPSARDRYVHNIRHYACDAASQMAATLE
jgi:hypothetical protein